MRIYLIIGIIAAGTALAAPPPLMQDGLWEITSQTELSGRPTPPKPTISQACYTKQDVERENAATPNSDKCEIRNYLLAGNQATWSITCIGKENITGHGSVTFHDKTAYSGTVKLRLQPEGQAEIRMDNNYSGKRIGDCSQ